MVETLVSWFVQNFGSVSKEATVFIVSLLPILELRGGIVAAALMRMDLVPAFIIAYIGNILPIPFILFFIQFIFEVLKKTPLKNMVFWLEKKAISKSESIKKYAYFGIFLFVAIPLPGTGAWTGALIASMLKMDIKKTFLMIALGVLAAGIIVATFSYGLLHILGA